MPKSQNPYLDFSPEVLVSAIQQAVEMLSKGYRSPHLVKQLAQMEKALASKGDVALDFADDFLG
jgi:hypothetical protein